MEVVEVVEIRLVFGAQPTQHVKGMWMRGAVQTVAEVKGHFFFQPKQSTGSASDKHCMVELIQA